MNLLSLAEAHRVGRFVFISTDKAVNPSSVMGATKRVAELLVQESALRSGLPYVAVRFGNVLGSSGSVVPLFREQISRGGPVTITHPDVRRFFMTIPEAVQLVLQAAALGEGADVFVLDMGAPICIEDLARDLIKLSGLVVGRDVEIVYTGLRPGEKMFEELSSRGEEYVATRHEKITKICNGVRGTEDSSALWNSVRELIRLAGEGNTDGMRQKLKVIVPEYAADPHAGAQAGHLRGGG
jgi:FlaA1/EpsC-like NDP-sugar epimerase